MYKVIHKDTWELHNKLAGKGNNVVKSYGKNKERNTVFTIPKQQTANSENF